MTHTFDVEIRWKEGLKAEAQPGGVPVAVPWSVPKDFGGPGGEWTPEHFLATSVASCIAATFLSIAKASKLEVLAYTSAASCTMDKTPEGLRITSVTVSPSIRVKDDKDVERARGMAQKAERLCPISNSLKAQVHLEVAIST